MFTNIGKKIQILAKVSFVIEAIGAIVTGFILLDGEAELGIPILIGGPFAALISAWFLYGFGELIVKTTEIADNTAELKNGTFQSHNEETDSEDAQSKLKQLYDNGLITQEEYLSRIEEKR